MKFKLLYQGECFSSVYFFRRDFDYSCWWWWKLLKIWGVFDEFDIFEKVENSFEIHTVIWPDLCFYSLESFFQRKRFWILQDNKNPTLDVQIKRERKNTKFYFSDFLFQKFFFLNKDSSFTFLPERKNW